MAGEVLITRCRQESDSLGTRFVCEYEISKLAYNFSFYIEHKVPDVQAAGQRALDRFMQRCGLERADGFEGREITIAALTEIEQDNSIHPERWKRGKTINERIRMAGYVYVFACLDSAYDLCKIGRAEDPERRLAQIATGCPYKLQLASANLTHDAVAVEAASHFHFRDARKSGEWFQVSPIAASQFIAEQVEKHNPR